MRRLSSPRAARAFSFRRWVDSVSIHNEMLGDPKLLETLGAYLPVEIHVIPQAAKGLTQQGQPVPSPVSGVALIDTGATQTLVHEPTVQLLRIDPVGKRGVVGPNGHRSKCNVYPVMLRFPVQKEWTVTVSHAIGGQPGQILTKPPQDLLVLLGRDFLASCILIWNGKGGSWSLAL